MRYSMLTMPLLVSVALGQAEPKGKPATPEAAIQALKTAIEAGDIKAVSAVAAGEPGAILRQLADPFAKAKAASDRFDKALQAKNIGFKNIFAPGLAPFAETQFDLVELVTEKTKVFARVKYGPRGKPREETVIVKLEEGTWRVGLPADLAKTVPSKERVGRQGKGFEKLAEVLNALAADVENGKLTTKDAVGLRMIVAMDEAKLTDWLK